MTDPEFSAEFKYLESLIKKLEERIIELEKRMTMLQPTAPRGTFDLQHDAWYWEH